MKYNINTCRKHLCNHLFRQIKWLSKIHEEYPPKDDLASVSLFYSKLNDRLDSIASRVHDEHRRRIHVLFGIVKNLYSFMYFLLHYLCKAKKLRTTLGSINSNEHKHVIIDYQHTSGKGTLGTPNIWSDATETNIIVFHASKKTATVNQLLANTSVSDVISFSWILLKISFKVPLIRHHKLDSWYEKTRELTNFYLFQFYLVGRYLQQYSGELVMLYEDQPRDRLLLYMLKAKYHVAGYLHSPSFQWYRFNLIYTAGDILYPNTFICEHPAKAKAFHDYKFLDEINIESISPTLSLVHLEGHYFSNIVVYLPDNMLIIDEYQVVFQSIAKQSGWDVTFAAHPATTLELRNKIWNQCDTPKLNKSTLVLASFMTNKGFHMMEMGYKVVYIGSDYLPWYNPFPSINIPFVKSPKDLFEFLSECGAIHKHE